MSFFSVWNLRKNRPIILIICLITLIALFMLIRPERFLFFFFKDEQVALTKGNVNENNVALTFNISWGDEKIHDILQVLADEKIQATFFVSGEWAERHPHILEKITEGNHEIAMLGYRYKNYVDQEKDQVFKDIVYAKEVFSKLGYDDVRFIRPPHGEFNEEIIDIANNQGLEVIYWSVNPRDFEDQITSEKIAKTVEKETAGGDIIMLHASDAATETAEAIKKFAPTLKKKGLSFVTVGQMKTEVETEEKLLE